MTIPAPNFRKVLATLAVVALGVWVGGMLALGAIAAPVVFGMVPAPTSADAMTVVFRRFDKLAVGCVVVALAVEAALAARKDRPMTRVDFVRGALAMLAAACAIGTAAFVSPRIEALHRGGAIRGLGAAGEELNAIHLWAERLGKAGLVLAVAVIALHIAALGNAGQAPPSHTIRKSR
jgi:hypothetical protein